MTNIHCANDPVFGYCKGSPDYDEPPIRKEATNKAGLIDTWLAGGHCRRDRFTCEFYSSHMDAHPVVNPKMVLHMGKGSDKESKGKKKGKKDKPEQGSLFE
jgi:hypothetical protein